MTRTYTPATFAEGARKIKVGDLVLCRRDIKFADGSCHWTNNPYTVTEETLAYFQGNHEDYELLQSKPAPPVEKTEKEYCFCSCGNRAFRNSAWFDCGDCDGRMSYSPTGKFADPDFYYENRDKDGTSKEEKIKRLERELRDAREE